jgi:hypothetical protein
MNTWIGYFLAKLKGKLLGNQYHHLNKWFCKQGINFTGGVLRNPLFVAI